MFFFRLGLELLIFKRERSFFLRYSGVMPKISPERREERREHILQAARLCLQEHGLEAVSMEMIIARSGLSTGAVYGYFKGKDEIINAAVSEGTAELGEYLVPLLTSPEPPPLPALMRQALGTIADVG